ncbi:uncharacterized protein LOC132204419 [Neocloeon triangulifer]|uniref:uncharacterized protein LOC132204419 n=1 Tax=Neocloeon triangulifer TaxID=2078957 RepID=UPI00286F7A0C|nr:uncharacterized protein LOC132204419 [Neocloeon triangulifer]
MGRFLFLLSILVIVEAQKIDQPAQVKSFDQKNYTNANKSCVEMGLHFFSVRNQKELEILHMQAAVILDDVLPWWVSARNYGKDDDHLDFRWQDGSKFEENSRLWAPDPACSTRRACVEIGTTDLRKLFCGTCLFPKNYICELPPECY